MIAVRIPNHVILIQVKNEDYNVLKIRPSPCQSFKFFFSKIFRKRLDTFLAIAVTNFQEI